jgi:uncharacterized LabA/DUF88 family protein
VSGTGIATEMLTDAFLDKFDTALLVSADSDLETPVEKTAKTAGKVFLQNDRRRGVTPYGE